MVRKARGLLTLAALAMLTAAPARQLWGQALPPAPVPVAAERAAESEITPVPSPAQAGALPLSHLGPPPAPGTVLGPPACAPYEDCNGPLLVGDPALDRPSYPPPGWFAALEIGVLDPHIKNRLTAPVTVFGFTDQVHLPTAELDLSGSPRLEVGYRFAEGFGELIFSYRSLTTDAYAVIPDFDPLGDGRLRSRLDLNAFDLDYSNREFSLGPGWDMKWQVGARIADVFFDSHALGSILEQRISNEFVGAGPHVGLELWRCLDKPGLSLFARLEAAVLLGKIRQNFEEVVDLGDGTFAGGATILNKTQAVPTTDFQAGLGWTPRWNGHWLRLSGGYQFEGWWYLGQVGVSRAELIMNGGFFRAEFSF